MDLSRLAMLWLSLGIVPKALGQLNEPHTGYIYPAGGQRGTTFAATVGGRYLQATDVYISGTGVSAKVLEQERQVTPKEQEELRRELETIRQGRNGGKQLMVDHVGKAGEIARKLIRFGRRLTNPSLGEFVTIRVTIAPSAPLGDRELRLQTRAGLSNPLLFNVGGLPEWSKKPWKNIPTSRSSMDPEVDSEPAEQSVVFPITLNGQIPPGGVDSYRFTARKGQQLVVLVRARELIPYISDAVPGWFQAAVTLYDAEGHELAYSDDYRFHPDPVLFHGVSVDGEYVLKIRDALCRGREDFVYRITIGELPFVTSVFPLGGRIGTQTTVAVAGWNLASGQLRLDRRNGTPGVHLLPGIQSLNRVPVAADVLPESFEEEPNDSVAAAQSVTLPLIVNGRVDRPGDMDVFRFEGMRGDQIVAEVLGRRLDSPLDSMLSITDATGKRLAFNDDHMDRGFGLVTHHADSYLAFTLPAAGTYYTHLGDTQKNGGEAHCYRLRISAPRPDFELRSTPSNVNVRGGTSCPITVHALRRDGFNGAIALSLRDAPDGFTLSGGLVPEMQDQVTFTLNAPPASVIGELAIEGRATIDGHEVVRLAVPADEVTQAFANRHLVPALQQRVTVVGRFNPRATARILTATPVQIPAGGTASIRVHMPVGPMVTDVTYELSKAPDGVTIRTVTQRGKTHEIVLQTDATKVTPGTRGNLIVTASAQLPRTSARAGGSGAAQRASLGALPAIPFEIVAH